MEKFRDEYIIEEDIETGPEDVKHPLSTTAEISDLLIDYKKVEIRRDDKIVLKNVEFQLKKGEFCYLVGKVGSGKSSLMKTMYADVPIDSGDKAMVLDYDLLKIKRSKIPFLRRKIGIVFQDFQLLTDRSV
ncbi:MAG: ATP-binding cassette domain-containing protein, partial [Muribaculaceae bacterium]|nr:ATP-binding cassette domain-containing protein [Muribaculaceae bacterium]